jgi:hypothetical protein
MRVHADHFTRPVSNLGFLVFQCPTLPASKFPAKSAIRTNSKVPRSNRYNPLEALLEAYVTSNSLTIDVPL